MSAYGFGGKSTNSTIPSGDTLAKKLSRWEHHRSETRDALESVEKASKQFQECCTSSSKVSAEEKIRSRNIFKREFERFKDALEKLENCLTMGYVLVVVASHSSHLDGLVCLLVLLRVRVVRCILVVLSSFLPLTRKRSFSRLLLYKLNMTRKTTNRANSARDFADRQKILLGFTEKKRIFVAQMEADDERSSLLSSSSNNNNGGSNNSKKLSAEEMTEGMTPEQLLRLQTQQIKSQDQTLHALSRLSTKLKATSGTIYNEIEEQMEIADDLEKDFKQTQMKMKALRKKGHELNGYRKNEIAEQDRKIRLEAEKEREKEIRAKEASQKGFWGWFNS